MLEAWNSEEIFLDGDTYFERLISDIDSAQKYITVEMYMFNDDLLGKKISQQLVNAHLRGVRVEVIVDGIGSYNFNNQLNEYFSINGIKVKIYNPLPFYHPYPNNIDLTEKISILTERIWRLNRRNHRKIFTIDYKILYVGSFNITSEHIKDHNGGTWKDMGVRVTGDHVNFAILNFKKTWKFKDFYRFRKKNHHHFNLNWRVSPMRLNQTVFMRRFLYKDLIWRMNRAKKRIWLMTPYFIPKRSLIKAIGKAALNGVDVKILISYENDVKLFKWLHYFYFKYLINKGVSIYHYDKSILHAKCYIIDNFITIGSSNLNHRSLLHDLEVDMTIQNNKNKFIIESNFMCSLNEEKKITMEYLTNRPWLDKILSKFIFLFRYWL
jgi:cardiolipin synthase